MPRSRSTKKITEAPKARTRGRDPRTRLEQFIREEERNVRERKHAKLSKEQIVAIAIAKARGAALDAPPRGPKGKARTSEGSANAYRKANVGPSKGRKKSIARKSDGGSGHRRV